MHYVMISVFGNDCAETEQLLGLICLQQAFELNVQFFFADFAGKAY